MAELMLRVHHLLCGVLYEGAGYSDAFVENMDRIVAALRNPQTKLRLVTSADSICAGCPNAMRDGGCALDDMAKKKSVGSLDERILRKAGLMAGECYTAEQAVKQTASHMDEEFFEQCCGECRWYRAGYCNYSKYEQNVNNYFLTKKDLK